MIVQMMVDLSGRSPIQKACCQHMHETSVGLKTQGRPNLGSKLHCLSDQGFLLTQGSSVLQSQELTSRNHILPLTKQAVRMLCAKGFEAMLNYLGEESRGLAQLIQGVPCCGLAWMSWWQQSQIQRVKSPNVLWSRPKKQTLNVQSFARRPRIQSYQGPSPAERSPIKRSFAKRKGNPNAKSQEQGMEVLDDSSRMEAQLSPYEPNLVLTRGILIWLCQRQMDLSLVCKSCAKECRNLKRPCLAAIVRGQFCKCPRQKAQIPKPQTVAVTMLSLKKQSQTRTARSLDIKSCEMIDWDQYSCSHKLKVKKANSCSHRVKGWSPVSRKPSAAEQIQDARSPGQTVPKTIETWIATIQIAPQ